MANIPDQPPSWAAVPLIEVSDPVLGGPDGAANRQAVAMLKRLQWTRNTIESVAGSVAGVAQQVGTATVGVDGALSTAQAATQTASSALSDASAARTTAESANTTAATAASNASTAKTMAESADTKATTATTTANTAKSTADSAAATAGTANTTANTARTIAEARAIRFDLPDSTLTYNVTLAVGAGARSLEANCLGARVGDAIFVSPKAAVPDGYGVGAAQCLAADKIRVSVIHPALALGANFSIPLFVYAMRKGT